MSGSTTTQQTGSSESVNQIPQWVQNAGQQNYGLAQQVANQPLQQYQGQMVAGVAPQTQQAWDLAANSGQVGQGAQNAAQAGYLNTLGQTPMSVTDPGNASMIRAGQLSNTNLQPYMNPFTQNVINATLPIMQQNLGLQQNQQQNAANAANAFGGSRQGVQQGVTQAQGAQNMAQMAQQLNQANFSQAQGAATTDIANRLAASQANQGAQQQNLNRNMQAQQLNQQAGLSQEQLANAAAGGLGTLGGQQMQNNIANYGMLTSAGGFQQQQAQNQINAQIAKLQQAFQYPQQQLGIMESALGMTPYNTATSGTSSSTTQATQSNPAVMALGGLSTLGGLFSGSGAAGTGPSAAANFMSMLGGSDRRLKTDIKRVDTHPSGVGIYAYRYKGDPKSYPKVVGPMAEDVAKIAPHAVRPMGVKGRLAVHMPTLDALRPGATPPSSPGAAKATGMLRPSATPGVLSPNATPPSRSIVGALGPRARPRVVGALG